MPMFAGARRPLVGGGAAQDDLLAVREPDPIPIESIMTPPDQVAALGRNLTNAQQPGFFARNGGLSGVLGTLSDAFSGSSKYRDRAMLAQQQQQQRADQIVALRRQQDQRWQDRQWQIEDRDARMNAPQYFNTGNDRVRFDPATGRAEVVYDGPEDYEAYASSLGLSPDDPSYEAAIKDYVLRANGPTALSGRQQLEGARQDNRVALRNTPTYAQSHPAPSRRGMAFTGAPRSPAAVISPILSKLAKGGPMTPGEQAALDYYRRPPGRGGRGSPAASAAPVRVGSRADYAKLPSGASYIAPDGSQRVKP
ncbi:hypothetical protein Q5H91_03565 [Sphingomonas sp. KR1UV-12]|uniref:Uncharacterized protein n=1 Tax=Sphingomonas aurea TaxID=3063994 RepID=A0ABT9EHL2_9SPHN|nr:hypothetical protein [Sphingomonas sp. KR1UV-12]MDP1026278.1 hypothetical protein [Sphingomonas sp. KR1UV-12]